MTRIGSAAILATFAGILLLSATTAGVQAASSDQLAQASSPDADAPEARVRRPTIRVPVYPRRGEESDGVYPRYYPGPNAVRVCNATYVPEYRPSGTVIVPRMTCFWRRG
jgi:hypothetical protein